VTSKNVAINDVKHVNARHSSARLEVDLLADSCCV